MTVSLPGRVGEEVAGAAGLVFFLFFLSVEGLPASGFFFCELGTLGMLKSGGQPSEFPPFFAVWELGGAHGGGAFIHQLACLSLGQAVAMEKGECRVPSFSCSDGLVPRNAPAARKLPRQRG